MFSKFMQENEIITNYKKLMVPYPLLSSYNSTIPLNIFQTWHTLNLPPNMKKSVELLKTQNPEFTHYLYDDDMCREFISTHFSKDVLNAFDILIPGAYKSDLWRYCILYINGGIYLDIKYKCINGFKLIALTEKEWFVRDYNPNNVYNALMVTKPKNQNMLICINEIVENVKNKYYGYNCLYPSGPALLGKQFTINEKNSLELYHTFTSSNNFNDYYIVKSNCIILNFYNGYREEQKLFQNNKHYGELWNERNIYK